MFSEQLARSAVQNLSTEGEISCVCVCVYVCVCAVHGSLIGCKRRQEERQCTHMCLCALLCISAWNTHLFSTSVCAHKNTFTLLPLSHFCPLPFFLCPPHLVSYTLVPSLPSFLYHLLSAPLCSLTFVSSAAAPPFSSLSSAHSPPLPSHLSSLESDGWAETIGVLRLKRAAAGVNGFCLDHFNSWLLSEMLQSTKFLQEVSRHLYSFFLFLSFVLLQLEFMDQNTLNVHF